MQKYIRQRVFNVAKPYLWNGHIQQGVNSASTNITFCSNLWRKEHTGIKKHIGKQWQKTDCFSLRKMYKMQNVILNSIEKWTLPKVKLIVEKHWHILQMHPKFKEILHTSPLIAFLEKTNQKQIIANNIIQCNKNLIISSNKFNRANAHHVYLTQSTFCCK